MRRRTWRPIEAPDPAAPNRSGEGAPASPHRRLGSTLLVQRRARAAVRLGLRRHLAVLEARVLLQEGQLDLADGAVPLLGDVDLGDALLLAVLGAVVLVAVEEADDVRVLLYRAGVVAHDAVREPGGRSGHRQVEHVGLAGRFDGDNWIPEHPRPGHGAGRGDPIPDP